MSSRPFSDLLLINQSAEAFEAAWRSVSRPRIESFLDNAPDHLRGELLDHLLTIELEIRRQRGEFPPLEEYLSRFPTGIPIVTRVYEGSESAG